MVESLVGEGLRWRDLASVADAAQWVVDADYAVCDYLAALGADVGELVCLLYSRAAARREAGDVSVWIEMDAGVPLSTHVREVLAQQRALDDMFAQSKEDLIQVFAKFVYQKTGSAASIVATLDRYFGVWEKLVPATGFTHGYAFPTGADLTLLLVCKATYPFGEVTIAIRSVTRGIIKG